MNFYEKNIALLRSLDPDLTQSILDTHLPAQSMEIHTTPQGIPTAKIKGVFIHSSHDPEKEAEKLITKEFPRAPEVCIFAGFGLGYQVERFIRTYPDTPVVVFEPDPSYFLKALEARNLDAVLTHPGISLLIGVNARTVLGFLETVKAKNVGCYILRSLKDIRQGEFEEIKDTVNTFSERETINKNTLKRFGKVWVRNLLKNIPRLIETPGISLFENFFSGIPACVIAGGPSLDAMLPYLKEIRKHCVLVAVDTSLRGCLAYGVIPDILVVVDPQYWNSRHMDHCTASDSILVSESSTHPSIFRIHKGPAFFCSSLFPLGRFIEQDTGIKGKLGAGGSVATTAWDLCRYMGNSPVIFTGLDLGFPGMATHFKSSFFEERLLYLANRLQPAETAQFRYLYEAAPFLIENNRGSTVLTDKRLIVYKRWFEQQMKIHTGTITKTLSSRGARITGMDRWTLEDVLNLEEKRKEIDTKLEHLRRHGDVIPKRRELVRKSTVGLIEALSGLKELAARCCELTTAVKQEMRSGNPVHHLISELEESDQAIMAAEIRDIAGFLLYDVSVDILSSSPASPEQALEKSYTLYSRLVESIDYHVLHLERALLLL